MRSYSLSTDGLELVLKPNHMAADLLGIYEEEEDGFYHDMFLHRLELDGDIVTDTLHSLSFAVNNSLYMVDFCPLSGRVILQESPDSESPAHIPASVCRDFLP
jgi:hypothetical protein